MAGLALVSELAIRAALVYIVVALAPLVFAAQLWPALKGVGQKLLRLLCGLILAKLAMSVALAVAAAAAVGTGSGGEVTSLPEPEIFAEDPGGSVTQAVGILLAATAAFGVAAFMPFFVAKLLPLAEDATVAQGLRSGPARGAQQGMSMAYYAETIPRLAQQFRSKRPKPSSTPARPPTSSSPRAGASPSGGSGRKALNAGPSRPKALTAGPKPTRALGMGARPMPSGSGPSASGGPGGGSAASGAAGSGAGGAAGGGAAAGAAAGPVGAVASAAVGVAKATKAVVQRGVDKGQQAIDSATESTTAGSSSGTSARRSRLAGGPVASGDKPEPTRRPRRPPPGKTGGGGGS
jgi:hypothetical protein